MEGEGQKDAHDACGSAALFSNVLVAEQRYDPFFLPASPAFAGQTVIIGSDVTGSVAGNSNGPNGTWSTPTDLLNPKSNTVILNNGTVTGYVYGGYAESNSGSATATGNSVTISGGTVNGNVHGGYARIISGSATATASGNSVTISGGTVSGNNYVYGGYVLSDSGSATASGNSVTISGGTVNSVYGGLVMSTSGSATATGNTVTLSGAPTFTNNSFLYGGLGAGSPADVFTGNTLNVWNYTSTAVGGAADVAGVANFEYYNFVMPASLPPDLLTVTNAVVLTDSSVTGVSVIGGAEVVQPGSTKTLLRSSSTITDATGHLIGTTVQGKHGATLRYDWTLNIDGGAFFAELNSVDAHPQAKSLSEGFLSGLALLRQGGDLVAGQGIGMAAGAASGGGFTPFGAIAGGWSRYDTGSHADVGGASLMAGLARGMDSAPGRLTLGAFFEFGLGVYDTYNSFADAAPVRSDGDAQHLGGGALARMDFQSAGTGRFYAEASARAGGMWSDHDGGDLTDGMGRVADYDLASPYFSLHLGVGRIWSLGDAASLDLSAKYFWTRRQGDSVTLATNDPVTFESADSHRLRLGARFSRAVNARIAAYAGAAYEHEFAGEAKASSYGFRIAPPSLRGGRGAWPDRQALRCDAPVL